MPARPIDYHLIVTTPTFDDRVDRFWLFAEVAANVPRCTILLKQSDAALLSRIRDYLAEVDTVGIRVFGDRTASGFDFQRWVNRQIQTCAGPEANQLILHDLFFGWSAIPSRLWLGKASERDLRRRTKRIVSFYFPNPSFARSVNWLRAPDYTRAERWAYLRMVGRRLLMEYVSCRVADYVAGNAADVVTDVQRYYRVAPNRTVLIPNNIVIEDFRFDPGARPSLGYLDRPTLLYVGSLQKRKGIYDILAALELLSADHPDVQLIMVGKFVDHEQQTFERRLADMRLSDRVHFVGFKSREELPAYYSSADVCLVPSYFEGSPRVMLEALACGCPVIASDIPGARIIDPTGEFVSFICPGDVAAIACAVDGLLRLPELRRSRSELGVERVTTRFSTIAIAARLCKFYEQVVESNSACTMPLFH